MLYFSKIKILSIYLIITVLFLFSLTNFIDNKENFILSKKVNLGLDLQGGSYLLLEVDSKPLINQNLQQKLLNLRKYLKKNNIKYKNLKLSNQSINLTLSNEDIKKFEKYILSEDNSINAYLNQYRSYEMDHSILEKSEEINIETKEALTDWVFWIIGTAFFCQVLALSGVITHIMPYLSSIGIERTKSGLIAGALPLATVLGRVGFGWLMDRVDKRGLAVLSFVLNSLGVLVLAFITPDETLLIVLFIIIYGVGWGSSVVLLAGLLNSYFGMKRLGTIIGYAGVFTMLAFVTGAPLAGWIFDHWGYYQPAWFVLAGLVGIATFLFAGLREPSNFSAKSA